MTTLSVSQTPDALNLRLRQYQEWAMSFAYCLQDANGNYDLNQPISLAGYTPIVQFRTSAMARTAVLEGTVTNGSIAFDATTCPQVQVSLAINCPPGKYEWDLRLIPANPAESIFLGRGTVQVDAEVSRNA